ncbi:PP2C family protein-serine/threonine phosphatase [Egibacter rhizosphaerae]|uniref:PP2C family protein-serine/threonine phosphatase n=1 Tax=Egibacter rhizosphaerae TaxID=1670831 RepID=UPI00197A8341|nr:GAF domain-containing SpoIIE family protein phosphatase [Egibacter rhizosphaerae]
MGATGVLPDEERERLEAVRRYGILDTPPDGAFDRIAALAARFFDAPIATVSIVDQDRIWFKATHGLDVDEVDRAPGLCASAILQADPYIVTDAISDPRALENPLVRGELGVRFYAAAPIRSLDGYNLGTVNVIAGEPREVTEDQIATLQDLAAIAVDELELRLAARRTVEAERARRVRGEYLLDLLQSWLLPQRMPEIPGVEVAAHYAPASAELQIGGDFYDVFNLHDGRFAVTIGDVCGKGPTAAAATGEIRQMLRALGRVEARPSRVLALLNEALVHEGMDLHHDEGSMERFCTACFASVDTSAAPLTISVANGGHPLALLRREKGGVEARGEAGDLVGAFAEFEAGEHGLHLEVGDMVLFYTDGAVEQRGQSIEVGEQTLRKALESAPSTSAEEALEHVRRTVHEAHETLDDDVALVLLRVLPSSDGGGYPSNG